MAATLDHSLLFTQACGSKQADELTDEEIVEAFGYGQSEWAIEQLYRRYKQYMYILAYRILTDSYLAEDVVQEVFFSLYYKPFSYQKELGSVKSWLQAIVRNRAIDTVRASVYREHQFAHLQEINGQDPSSSDPEMWEQVWGDEQSTLIHKALAQLPSEQRRVIELNYFSETTHAEIAAQLKIPLGTVKGRIRLGLQKAKQLLQEYGLDGRTALQR